MTTQPKNIGNKLLLITKLSLVKRKYQKEKIAWAGADTQIWTGDLTLTKGALYRLSYISTQNEVERAAGIEPASSAWKAEVIAIIRCPHT